MRLKIANFYVYEGSKYIFRFAVVGCAVVWM